MLGALNRLATRFSAGEFDAATFPWHFIVDRDLAQLMWSTAVQGLSAKTATRDASALRVMLECCYRAGILTYEQYRDARSFEAKGGTPRPPAGTYLTNGEIGALLDACENCPGNEATGIRDAALIMFLAGSGPNRMEVENVELRDVHLPELRVWLGRTKGGTPRYAWLHPAAADRIGAWLAIRGEEPGPLFVPLSRTGRPLVQRGALSSHQIWKIVRTRGDQAGIAGLTPHDMRRFLISHLLPTTDVTLVARIVGHARISTTAAYDRRPQEEQRRAIATLVLPAPPTKAQMLARLGEPVRDVGRAFDGQATLLNGVTVDDCPVVARIAVANGPDGAAREFEIVAPTVIALTDQIAALADHVCGMNETYRATYTGLFFSGLPMGQLDDVTADLLQ